MNRSTGSSKPPVGAFRITAIGFDLLGSELGTDVERAVQDVPAVGYALGMNFRDSKGRREILFPDDLDEIVRDGVTVNGCRIR